MTNVTISKKITRDELSRNDDGIKVANENGTLSHYMLAYMLI